MRVLQLCPKPPRPAIDGGCIAMENITRGLLDKGHEVRVLTIFTHKHPRVPDALSPTYLERTSFDGVFVDTKLNFVDAFSNLITRDSYNISRFFSADYDMKLQRLLEDEEFDVVHIESLFMTPYIDTIRRLSDAVVVMRSHNLEFKIWQRMAKASTSGPRRAYLKLLAKRLKNYELRVMNQVDGVVSISPEDETNYGQLDLRKPIITVPFGVDSSAYPPELGQEKNLNLYHLGAMDWMPNVEGVQWFLSSAWEDIKRDWPETTLNLAGKGSKKFTPPVGTRGVVTDGQVPDSKEYMRENGVMIVPLLSGGGIRIKIIEGMALGKVIISTTIGAEGIGVTHNEDILIADTPEEMRSCMRRLHEEPGLYSRLSTAAQRFIRTNYDYSILADRLIVFYGDLQKKRGGLIKQMKTDFA